MPEPRTAPVDPAPRRGWTRVFHGHDLRHGLQLAAAVVIAYLLSAAAGLPEGFWAVMSALIVTRPDTGATLAAGWDRVRGTLLGTACGLAGVWLRHAGLGLPAATLAIVAVLAFASASVPIMRSAPITALIVLSSGGIARHTPMQVAGLRVAEIAIGVTVGLAISVALPASRAAHRFDGECAAALRLIARHLRRALEQPTRSAEEKEAARIDMRAMLRQLGLLGQSAGRETRFSWRRLFGGVQPEDADAAHSRVALLVARTSQDAGLFGRLYESHGGDGADPLWAELRETACSALEGAARQAADGTRPDYSPFRRVAGALKERRRQSQGQAVDEVALLLAGPVRWLLEDLGALARRAAKPADAQPAGVDERVDQITRSG